MSFISSNSPFTFKERPSPVPGDLRITWRFALNLLILSGSRMGRSSLARLYILNDAARSFDEADLLGDILIGAARLNEWRIKVEPALGRALDLMAGESLITWATVSDRLGVELTPSGLAVAKQIEGDDEILLTEKNRLGPLLKQLTETRVKVFLKVSADHVI